MEEGTKDIFSKELFNKYNIKPTKSLGQNFLIDNLALNSIVDALNIKENDIVIEIGAGMGALSKRIAKNAKKFITIEIDKHLIPPLNEVLKEYPQVKIINADFLELCIEREINNYLKHMPDTIKIVGNLPYYITTPIIMKLLELDVNINAIVVMVQKEVVNRMIAKPGTNEYGPLAIALQYFSNPEILFDVPPHCFFPKPKVSSTVVRFTGYKRYDNSALKVHNKKLFIEVVKASFAQRRKTLINSLTNSNLFSLDKEAIKNIINKLEIDENIRGEALSLAQFIQLTNTIEDYIPR